MIREDFAAFVITYNRRDELLDSLNKIRRQTVSPKKILVVDNGSDPRLETILAISFDNVFYVDPMVNTGPAGGAKIGLETLSNEGFKWIYWGDDDDPPKEDNWFELLLALGDNCKKPVGQLGVVGHYFSCRKGEIVRVSDKLLHEHSGPLEVDTIAGNMCKIINGDVLSSGCIPRSDLFFGFEELQFDLQLKKNGYHSLVDTDIFLECRKATGRIGYKRKVIGQTEPNLVRQYYSERNLIVILKEHDCFVAILVRSTKVAIKCLMSFRKGFNYGTVASKLLLLALIDGFLNRLGRRNLGEVGKL